MTRSTAGVTAGGSLQGGDGGGGSSNTARWPRARTFAPLLSTAPSRISSYQQGSNGAPPPPAAATGTASRSKLEFVVPQPDHESRQASLHAAVFSLVSTIIGGGVLSIPYAMRRSGLILGSLLLAFVAFATSFSVYILISASRRSGGNSYEQVAYAAFGAGAASFTQGLLFVTTYLSLVAYAILMRDLYTPLLELVTNTHFNETAAHYVMIGAVALVLPVSMLRKLNALRFTSAISILAMCVLAIAVGYRSVAFNLKLHNGPFHPDPPSKVSYVTSDIEDVLASLPILSVAFLCHFNAIEVHGELVRPSRRRVKRIIYFVFAVCAAFYLIIGVLGYLWAYDLTQGDVLENFSRYDHLISIGRLALGITVSLSYPLLVQPCRRTFEQIILKLRAWWNDCFSHGGGVGAREEEWMYQEIASHGHINPTTTSKKHGDPAAATSPTSDTQSIDGRTFAPAAAADEVISSRTALLANQRALTSTSAPASAPVHDYSQSPYMKRKRKDLGKRLLSRRSSEASNSSWFSSSANSSDGEMPSPMKQRLKQQKKRLPAAPVLGQGAALGDDPTEALLGGNEEDARSGYSDEFDGNIESQVTSSMLSENMLVRHNRLVSIARDDDVLGADGEKGKHFVDHDSFQARFGHLMDKRKGGIHPAFGSVDSPSASEAGDAFTPPPLLNTPHDPSSLVNALETLFLVSTSVIIALKVKAIVTVWSLMGSTCSVIIAYILPSAFYIKLRAEIPFNYRKALAWALLVGGCITLVCCSFEAVKSIGKNDDAPQPRPSPQ